MADYWEPSGDEDEPVTSGLGKREKRLARNRESARKCRKKRKAFVNEMAEKVQALTEDNAILELENRRLQELVRQLQSGASTAPAPSSRKRVKREQGALVANDFSESAAGDVLLSAGHLDHPVATSHAQICDAGAGVLAGEAICHDSSRDSSICASDAEDPLPPASPCPTTTTRSMVCAVKSEPGTDGRDVDGLPSAFVESFSSDPCLSELVASFADDACPSDFLNLAPFTEL